MADTIVIVDFGGQYKELIARRVRELGVYSLIKPSNITPDALQALAPKGIIFTGGPNSVYGEHAKLCDPALFTLGIPVLGICYGMQLMCHMQGGRVASAETSEYGAVEATIDPQAALFSGMQPKQQVLMSHTDRVVGLPQGFSATAYTANCPIAAFENREKNLYGVQFHPETELSAEGMEMLRRFVFDICRAEDGYTMDVYLKEQIEAVKKQVGDRHVLLGLSGGVDSSVCAALLAKALPGQVTCIYVDHGFMRKNETEQVKAAFSQRDLTLIAVDASENFLAALAGVSEPEQKRKIIGRLFVETFEKVAKTIGKPEFLAQGTIYPDVVESGTDAAVIKSHHNVGGLPKDMGFIGVVEPLRGLFKDEVRRLGKLLGLPDALVNRQPFPGPGLAIRVLGEITREKLDILREADAIYREELDAAQVRADQYFAVLTNTRTVGVMGDFRTYDYVLALRAVTTSDFMTADFTKIPWDVLQKVSARITNEVKGVNRIVYDVTPKPPATIEWE